MKRIYLPGAYVSEDHIRRAWARARAGVRLELAVASVLPSSKRINSMTRAAYESNLISILSLKRHLFTLACQQAREGGDWRKVFRGRRSIFWPDVQERTELGLTDFTSHEVILPGPYKGRPLKVKMTVDHRNKLVKDVVLVSLNGRGN